VLLISDEVYEHMVFDGQGRSTRARRASRPGGARLHREQLRQDLPRDRLEGRLRGRAGSLTAEFRKVHQFNVFTVNTPVQHGLAAYMADPQALPGACRRSTSASATCSATAWPHALQAAAQRRQLLPVRGHLRRQRPDEAEFCKWLTTEIGVAAIPLSAFYGNGFDQRVVRFCFAKKDETLNTALERLAKLL
jgi:methionine aminotransferase